MWLPMWVDENMNNKNQHDLGIGESSSLTFSRINKQGNEALLEAICVPVSNGGNIRKIFKIANDVTAARQAETKLSNVQRSLDKSMVMIRFFVTGVIEEVNENFSMRSAMMGYIL
ncbi:hypothetical protein [Alteromonas hispanica]|nr:hypothetical protein [Alteromonas hispanica]